MTVRPNIDPHDEIAWGPSGGRASDVPITDKGAPNPLGDDPTDAEPLAPNRADPFLRVSAGFFGVPTRAAGAKTLACPSARS